MKKDETTPEASPDENQLATKKGPLSPTDIPDEATK
jgi:hypothetical protein